MRQACRTLRGNLEAVVSSEESATINSTNNAPFFPTLMTRAGSKDNPKAAMTDARNTGGNVGGTATATCTRSREQLEKERKLQQQSNVIMYYEVT